MPLFGIIPFYGIALTAPPGVFVQLPVFEQLENGFFEAVSGFTGTGLTMIDNPTEIPYILQWWRTFSEWIGGIGVIMLASLLLKLNHDDQRLYRAETRDWTIKKDAPVTATIRKIWWIYLAYTVASIVIYYLAGMPFWESLNHGMTALGTGGFSVTPNSFTDYSTQIKALTVVIMIMGAIAFKIHYLVIFKFDIKALFRQTQLYYFFTFLIGALLVLLWISSDVPFVNQAKRSVFIPPPVEPAFAPNNIKMTRTNTVDIPQLPTSTVFNPQVASAEAAWKTRSMKGTSEEIHKRTRSAPEESEANVIFDGEVREEKEIRNHIQQAANILFLWLLTLSAGTFVMSLLIGGEYTFYQILFDTASALSNVGLSTGVTGADMPVKAKYLLSLLMWLGRLEIMAVVILIISPFYLAGNKLKFSTKKG